jgi:hypothetical protein
LQIVRIGGAHLPSKMSTIYEFAKVELRPDYFQTADVLIPAQTTASYWLAIQVFSNGAPGWNCSAIRTNASLRVPEAALAFDDCEQGRPWSGGSPSVVVSIMYDAPLSQPTSGIEK